MNINLNMIACAVTGLLVGGIAGFVVGHHSANDDFDAYVAKNNAERERIAEELREERRKRREMVTKIEEKLDESIHANDQPFHIDNFPTEGTEEAGEPVIISKEDYDVDEPYAPSGLLTYYRRNGVLADVHDLQVICPVEEIGEAALAILREQESDDPVYVHNPAKNLNYEICFDDDNDYFRDIIGEEDEDEDEEDFS